MSFDLTEINRRMRSDPVGFAEECDAAYFAEVTGIAGRITQNIHRSHIILLAGPSGSGKTTTALNIERELDRIGLETHTISMDDYYQDVDPLTTPRNAQGEYDFESPELLDLALLQEHFQALDAGEEIVIPHYDFHSRKRDMSQGRTLRLGQNEIALFEGIHALNGKITGRGSGAGAFKLYISARSDVEQEGKTVFKGTWMRMLRRVIRDVKFRNTSAVNTFAMWENLRVGEKRFISPYKNSADVLCDTSLAYEVGLLRNFSEGIFDGLPESMPRREEALRMRRMLELFEPMDAAFLSERSLMHEFVG